MLFTEIFWQIITNSANYKATKNPETMNKQPGLLHKGIYFTHDKVITGV
jgi:hypothetical protein